MNEFYERLMALVVQLDAEAEKTRPDRDFAVYDAQGELLDGVADALEEAAKRLARVLNTSQYADTESRESRAHYIETGVYLPDEEDE